MKNVLLDIIHCIDNYYTREEAMRYLNTQSTVGEWYLKYYGIQFPERLSGTKIDPAEKRRLELVELSLQE